MPKNFRIVLHIDMDSFYASCEQRQNPSLAGVPVAVCIFSGRDADSGAISTANYEARKLGVKSGMPIKIAKRIAPNVAYLPANFPLYQATSDSIMEIVRKHAKQTQQASIDEIYAEITQEASGDFKIASTIAQKIKMEILGQEKLTCSVGIGPNKLIAKMASDFQKPNGLTVIEPEKVQAFLEVLPVKKLLGVGPKTEEELEKLGIRTLGELKKAEMAALIESFGESKGRWLYEGCRGIDDSEVKEPEMPEQISRIATLKTDTSDPQEVAAFCSKLAQSVVETAKGQGIGFKTASLIVILANLKMHTKSRSFEAPIDDLKRVQDTVAELARAFFEENELAVCRRAGVRVTGLEKKQEKQAQKSLAEF